MATPSPSHVSYPPLDGSLLFPDLIEFNAKHNPTQPFYVFYDEVRTKGICHISHLEFYHACQRVAHAIRPGRQGPDNEIIAIMVNCDSILYQALTMGVIYAGHVPFPMSPRNSPAAVVDMMCKTDCHRLIATCHSLGPLLDSIRAHFAELHIKNPPSLAHVFPALWNEKESAPLAPYPKAKERPAKDDVMLYVHSSGSTGFPKAIPITNLVAVLWCMAPSMRDHVNSSKYIISCAASLPSFHVMGAILHLFLPVVSLTTVALFSPTSFDDPTKGPIVPNPQNTIELVRLTRSNALSVAATFLEQWSTSTEAVEVLRSLEYVCFGGGPLAKKSGDVLVAAGVKLSSGYGGTEFGPLTHIFPNANARLWEWLRFGSNQNIRWAPQGDGTYECQVLTSSTNQPSIENLVDPRGYATSDIFVKHPTIEGLYKIVGRMDDVLTHSSGEKTVPAPMETVISSSPFLSAVCMFGRGRHQTGVLVEPRPEYAIDVTDNEQVADMRNKIWREVEDANKDAPAFSRIFKEMILVTNREKPMLRTGKGTVMKKATMKLYEKEIDALYASVEASANAGLDVSLPLTWSQFEVENWLMVHATAVNAGKLVEVDVDVFEQGFDSLSSTFLKNRIIGSLAASTHEQTRAAASRVSQTVIFSNPTIRLLARYLIRLLSGEVGSLAPRDPKTEIEEMIFKYSVGLEDSSSGMLDKPHDRHVVLLTGTTGGLGSYLLASLLGREDVGLVYAFNRPSKSSTVQERQRSAFEDRGFETSMLDSDKLVFIEGDAAQPNLSLDDGTYAEIRDSVTTIIHNAWRLDFNLSLSSFEPNVRGTRHLIDLARASKWSVKPRFLFTSSVASAQGWDKSKGAFPEAVQYDAGVAVGPGYGASKYVSERILAKSGLPATSFRIGQITGGAPRGAWSTTDWVPMIVKSSVTLGALPEARGLTSWLPPRVVSNAIFDVAFADEAPPIGVNLVHPQPVAWMSVIQPISDALHQKGVTPSALPLIPFSDWVQRLEDRAVDATRLPAIKLLGFMRAVARGDAAIRSSSPSESEEVEVGGSPRFATDIARHVSETMHSLVPLAAADAAQWVDYWESVGMFEQVGRLNDA